MGRPTKAQAAVIALRRAETIRLRIEGKTPTEIAALQGRDITKVSQDISRALAERTAAQVEAADQLRTLELDRLDALYVKVWEVLDREHVTVSHGKVIERDGRPLLDDDPVLRAVDRLVRIAERRARLLGLDSPVKVAAEGVVTFRVEGVDLAGLT